jgi:hypothetical protein
MCAIGGINPYASVIPNIRMTPEFAIIEVYLDRADDSLRAWSADPVGKRPSGETIEELIEDLRRILWDAREWKPVDFDDLRAGVLRTGRDRGHHRTRFWAN